MNGTVHIIEMLSSVWIEYKATSVEKNNMKNALLHTKYFTLLIYEPSENKIPRKCRFEKPVSNTSYSFFTLNKLHFEQYILRSAECKVNYHFELVSIL